MTEEEVAALQAKAALTDKLMQSVAALEAKNKEILGEKSKAKAAAAKAAEKEAKKAGDIDALEKSWLEKLANKEAEFGGKLSEYEAMMQKITVGSAAQKMASEMAINGSAEALLPHISSRLKVEMRDGIANVRILDANGKISAATLDDLKKEIVNNKALAPILVASKASGTGPAGARDSTVGGATMKRRDWDSLAHAAKAKFFMDGGQLADD